MVANRELRGGRLLMMVKDYTIYAFRIPDLRTYLVQEGPCYLTSEVKQCTTVVGKRRKREVYLNTS